MHAIIAPTELGYSLDDVKRACLSYERVFLLEPGDRDLFPSNAFFLAMGMPPIASMPGPPVRPLAKVPDYDEQFARLQEDCRPLIDEGIIEVTRTWNRSETDDSTLRLGAVPMGGYPLDVKAVLFFFRGLARDSNILNAAIDDLAVELAQRPDAEELFKVASADGSINGDELPLLQGLLQNEDLRRPLTVITRSRLATALKIWGVAEQERRVPVLPASSASLLDRVAQAARAAIDAVEQDPYWTRRTAILDVVLGEFLPDERLSTLSSSDLLHFRTKAMTRFRRDRTELFAELREMAAEKTNVDLDRFRDKIRSRLDVFIEKLRELRSERADLGWGVFLDVSKGTSSTAAAGLAVTGLFHVALPTSLTAAAFGALAWGLGKSKDYLPALRGYLAADRDLKETNEYAVFRRLERWASSP